MKLLLGRSLKFDRKAQALYYTSDGKIQVMAKSVWPVLWIILLLVSCATAPDVAVETSYSEPRQPIQKSYEQMFDEFQIFINYMNSVISRRQYTLWEQHLTTSYKENFGSEEYLKKISEYPILKDKSIRLKSLEDYFNWVVVPSRSHAVLEDIVQVGQTQVIAYSTFDGKRAKLYELENMGDEWKITVW